MISEPLAIALKIAPDLLKVYEALAAKGKLDRSALPTLDELTKGLARLVIEKKLPLPDLEKSIGLPDSAIKMLEDAIRATQSGLGGIFPDGILGKGTLGKLFEIARSCPGRLGKDRTGIGETGPNEEFEAFEFRYFIEGIPEVRGADASALLESAWGSWKKTVFMRVSRTKIRSKANVIVKLASIDGPSNVLADAHVGPPVSREQLELRFDASEDWDPFTFEATACHEIGHLMGLHHSADMDDLMAPRLGDMKAPTLGDKSAAKVNYPLDPPDDPGEIHLGNDDV